MVLNVGVHGKDYTRKSVAVVDIDKLRMVLKMYPCSSLYHTLSIYPYRFVLMKRMAHRKLLQGVQFLNFFVGLHNPRDNVASIRKDRPGCIFGQESCLIAYALTLIYNPVYHNSSKLSVSLSKLSKGKLFLKPCSSICILTP